MKKYILFLLVSLLTVSCDDFLDTKDLTNKSSQNFPQNGNDCNQSLAAIYNTLTQGWMSSFYIGALASDEAFGAGAANDYDCHGFDRWRVSAPDMAQAMWKNYYAGIYRTNKLIESLDNVKFTSDAERKKITGEAYFLRAYFYSELVKVFGEVPLLLSAAKPLTTASFSETSGV